MCFDARLAPSPCMTAYPVRLIRLLINIISLKHYLAKNLKKKCSKGGNSDIIYNRYMCRQNREQILAKKKKILSNRLLDYTTVLSTFGHNFQTPVYVFFELR